MAETEVKVGREHILHTPLWIMIIHIIQFLLALIILAMAGTIISDVYFDEPGLALAIGIITWVFVGYIVLTEKISALHAGYNIIAVLVLEGLMVILWLATFAAVAAARARFRVDVNVSSCFDDGSSVDSMTCWRKRDLMKRQGVLLFESGLDMMSAIAGLGALVWLLFITTFSWIMVHFFRARKEGRFLFNATPDTYQMEAKPTPTQPTTDAPVQTAAPVQPQHTGQYSQPQQGQYPPQYAYQQSVSPYQNQGPYPPPQQGGYPAADMASPQGQYPPQQYQQPVHPQGTGHEVSPMQSQVPLYHQQNELMGPEHGVPHTSGELMGSPGNKA